MNKLNKNNVDYIVVHCSDTRLSQPCNADIIDGWHRQRGFEMIGYHYVILPDGTIEHGRPLFCQGAHVGKPVNYNPRSIGVCYVGGRGEDGRCADTRTEAQKSAMLLLLSELKKRFPKAQVLGHRDLNRGKECPCFDARQLNAQLLNGETLDRLMELRR